MGKQIRPVHIVMIIVSVVFIAALAGTVVMFSGNSRGRKAVITQNGNVLYEIELDRVSEPYSIRIDGEGGCYNIIEVRNGEIGVSEASCPDKVCVNMGYISDGLLPVTCLPNRVVIKIEGGNDSDADIAVY